MSRIERVYVALRKEDLRLARICIASIRRWYPEIPIFLLKDAIDGDFSTTELQDRWNVNCWPTSDSVFGWGFIKLEPLFAEPPCRYLVLDSDIVILGRVIDELEKFDEDFVVQEELQAKADIPSLYFDEEKLKMEVDATFRGVAFTFNTGQYVATSGKLKRDDFEPVINWTCPRSVKNHNVFNPSDQGILNYVVLSKVATGAITVARTPFMRWSKQETQEFDVASLNADSPYPFLIHWAGIKKLRMRHMMRADILQHFESAYYSRIPCGPIIRRVRLVRAEIERWERRIARKLKRLPS